MTEKAIEWFSFLREKFVNTEFEQYLNMAISALEQTNEDLISRKAVLDFTTEWCNRCGKRKEYDGVMCKCCDLADTIDFVEELPTIPQTAITQDLIDEVTDYIFEYPNNEFVTDKEYELIKYIAHRVKYILSEKITQTVEKQTIPQTDSVLDSIKAEIQAERHFENENFSIENLSGLVRALQIIDKHISRKE